MINLCVPEKERFAQMIRDNEERVAQLEKEQQEKDERNQLLQTEVSFEQHKRDEIVCSNTPDGNMFSFPNLSSLGLSICSVLHMLHDFSYMHALELYALYYSVVFLILDSA
jgi:phosphoglycerate-specific signal transduction histidine kinase